MVLTFRRVRYYDRSGFVPKKVSVDLNVEEEVFTGITDPNAIVHLVMMKVLTRSPIGNLDVNPEALQRQMGETIGKSYQLGDVVFSKAPTAVTDKAGAAVKKTTEGAKRTVTGIFGKFRPKPQEQPAPA